MKTLITSSILALLAAVSCLSSNASAQSLIYDEDFTTNQTSLFEFAAFSGNTSFNSSGLNAFVPGSTQPDTFGGIATAPIAPVSLDGLTSINVTAQAEPGNLSDLIISVREGDGAGGDGEFFSFTIPQSAFSAGGFVTVPVDIMSGFNGDTGNPGADGILNGPLSNVGPQSPFGGTAEFNYTLQSVEFVGSAAVPEPTSLVLLAGLGSILAVRRRRS